MADVLAIQIYNQISEPGLSRLPASTYRVGKDEAEPVAILVRSADLHKAAIPASVRAIARAGAGTNNIPVAQMSARGVPVFNAPGANANAVKELVLAGMLMAAHNRAKAAVLYKFLDDSDFFVSPIVPQDRSLMNAPFKLRDESLDAAFLKGAEERHMLQLKGHRSVGGMRASMYNAMPVEGIRALVAYMKEFEARHG